MWNLTSCSRYSTMGATIATFESPGLRGSFGVGKERFWKKGEGASLATLLGAARVFISQSVFN